MSSFEFLRDQHDHNAIASLLHLWPLFDAEVYRALHADLSNVPSPLHHFAQHGLWEGRAFSTPLHMVRKLINLSDFGHEPPAPTRVSEDLIRNADIGVYVSSRSNFFMREIADRVVHGLRCLGLNVTRADERSPPENRSLHCIFVAPHEFFSLGNGTNWQRPDVVRNSLMLSTEQPQTVWFKLSLPYLLTSRGVIELCWQSHQSFCAAGLPSHFYVPGFPPHFDQVELPIDLARTPLLCTLPKAALDYQPKHDVFWERPIDVTFMGTESEIREEFFGRASETLSRLNSFILYRRLKGGMPPPYGTDREVEFINQYIYRRSKILLNVHRDEVGYFEIHRLGMQGIVNGALVVTNKCLPHPFFKSGEHFLEESLSRIPSLLEWLVETLEGQREGERVRRRAYQTYVEQLPARTQSLGLAQFLSQCFQLEHRK